MSNLGEENSSPQGAAAFLRKTGKNSTQCYHLVPLILKPLAKKIKLSAHVHRHRKRAISSSSYDHNHKILAVCSV